MVKRTVILSSRRKKGAFGTLVMPDGTNALVVDKQVHQKALKAAGQRLNLTVREIKQEADGRQPARASG